MANRRDALDTLGSHWAISAIDAETRRLAIATAASRSEAHPPPDLPLESEQAQRILTVATAYDLAAREGLDAVVRQLPGEEAESLRTQLEAGAARAFTLYSVLDLPATDPVETLYHVLHVAALGVVARRREDVRAWLERQPLGRITAADRNATWDAVLRSELGGIWLDVLRGPDRPGMERVIETLGRLREAREASETALLAGLEKAAAANMRFHLFTLYHLLDAAASLILHVARDADPAIRQRLFEHFTLAGAAATGDPTLSIAISWLHAAAHLIASWRDEQLEMPGLTG